MELATGHKNDVLFAMAMEEKKYCVTCQQFKHFYQLAEIFKHWTSVIFLEDADEVCVVGWKYLPVLAMR